MKITAATKETTMLEEIGIVGTDLVGRKCIVARVYAPSGLDNAALLKYVQRDRPITSEVVRLSPSVKGSPKRYLP